MGKSSKKCASSPSQVKSDLTDLIWPDLERFLQTLTWLDLTWKIFSKTLTWLDLTWRIVLLTWLDLWLENIRFAHLCVFRMDADRRCSLNWSRGYFWTSRLFLWCIATTWVRQSVHMLDRWFSWKTEHSQEELVFVDVSRHNKFADIGVYLSEEH